MENTVKVVPKVENTGYAGFLAPQTQRAKEYWNKFCWYCHKIGSNNQDCPNCSHVFHIDCFGTDAVCRDCQSNNIQTTDSSDFRRMLKMLVEKLFADNDFTTFNDHYNPRKPLTEISGKIPEYSNFDGFLDDIRWAVHKCFVVYGENKLTTTAARLLIFCTDDVEDMQVCSECYVNSCQTPDQYMTTVCQAAHPVVWARLSSDSYHWPAKQLIANNHKVTVRFFGHHAKGEVASNDCLAYSHEYPDEAGHIDSWASDNLETARKEADVYAENLRKLSGSSSSNSSLKSFVWLPKRSLSPDNRHEDLPGPSFRQVQTKRPSITSTSTSLSNEHTYAKVADTVPKCDRPNHSMPINGKRHATDPPPAPSRKARKSFPTPINIEIVSGCLKVNSTNMFQKSDALDNKVAQLEAEKERLNEEINSQKLQIVELNAKNQRMKTRMGSINTKWEAKVKAAKRQSCCINCGHSREEPFYCSRNCQMAHWKQQSYQHDD